VPSIARHILGNSPPKFCAIGFSFGGFVALELIRQAPDRVSMLALLNTSARPESQSAAKSRLDRIRRAQFGQHEQVLSEQFLHMVHPDHVEDPKLFGLWKEMGIDYGREAFIRTMNAGLNRPDARSILKTIVCPTLVVAGDTDEVAPPSRSHEISGAISNSRLIVLSICGHLSPIEQPALLSAALEQWLNENIL
jgi:pimeloyl-ACP methyl ester carboxylesterase